MTMTMPDDVLKHDDGDDSHNGGQQQLKQEDDALTNSTQKGEPGNGHAVGSRDHMEADACHLYTSDAADQ